MSDDLDFGSTVRGYSAGQKVFSRYTLQKILGRGGMGVVWLARDEELERDIALKFLPEIVAMDEQAIRELKRETRRSLELTHPHIIRIYDFIQDARSAAISMEFVDGQTLAGLKLAQPAEHFEVAQIETWIEQLCAALDYAHTQAEIVHRDLKPANLMVDAKGNLKIADFGIAASVSDSVSRVSAQASSSGTPVYMSPQQMMGEKPAITDDIYALGATLFDLLTGKPPFYAGNVAMQVMNKAAPTVTARRIENETTGDPIPAPWEATIAACLAKQATDRPASIQELRQRLQDAPPAPAPVAAPPQEKPTATPRSSRNPLRFAAIAAGVAAIALAGWWFGVEQPRQRTIAELQTLAEETLLQQDAVRQRLTDLNDALEARRALGLSSSLESEPGAQFITWLGDVMEQNDPNASREALESALAAGDLDAANAAAEKLRRAGEAFAQLLKVDPNVGSITIDTPFADLAWSFTPTDGEPVTGTGPGEINDLEYGTYDVELSRRYFPTVKQRIVLSPGKPITLDYDYPVAYVRPLATSDQFLRINHDTVPTDTTDPVPVPAGQVQVAIGTYYSQKPTHPWGDTLTLAEGATVAVEGEPLGFTDIGAARQRLFQSLQETIATEDADTAVAAVKFYRESLPYLMTVKTEPRRIAAELDQLAQAALARSDLNAAQRIQVSLSAGDYIRSIDTEKSAPYAERILTELRQAASAPDRLELLRTGLSRSPLWLQHPELGRSVLDLAKATLFDAVDDLNQDNQSVVMDCAEGYYLLGDRAASDAIDEALPRLLPAAWNQNSASLRHAHTDRLNRAGLHALLNRLWVDQRRWPDDEASVLPLFDRLRYEDAESGSLTHALLEDVLFETGDFDRLAKLVGYDPTRLDHWTPILIAWGRSNLATKIHLNSDKIPQRQLARYSRTIRFVGVTSISDHIIKLVDERPAPSTLESARSELWLASNRQDGYQDILDNIVYKYRLLEKTGSFWNLGDILLPVSRLADRDLYEELLAAHAGEELPPVRLEDWIYTLMDDPDLEQRYEPTDFTSAALHQELATARLTEWGVSLPAPRSAVERAAQARAVLVHNAPNRHFYLNN